MPLINMHIESYKMWKIGWCCNVDTNTFKLMLAVLLKTFMLFFHVWVTERDKFNECNFGQLLFHLHSSAI